MTRKKEYLWVVRPKDLPTGCCCVVGQGKPEIEGIGFFSGVYSCYSQSKRVFGSFRIGEVKRFSIPLKQIRGK